MGKKTTAVQNQRAVDLLLGAKFGAVCSLIIGYPGETVEDLALTINFIRKNRRRMLVKAYACIPFPGTKLWSQFVALRGIDSRSFDWSRLRIEDIDWDKYPFMAEYERERLIDVVERTQEI